MIDKYPEGKSGPLFVVDISDLISPEGLEWDNLHDTADMVAFRVSQIKEPIEIPDEDIEALQEIIWKMDSEAERGSLLGFCRELAVLYSWGRRNNVDFGPTYQDPMMSSYGWPPIEEVRN